MDGFQVIKEKVIAKERLTVEEACFLYEYEDLLALGALADQFNQSRNQKDVYYNINRHINSIFQRFYVSN